MRIITDQKKGREKKIRIIEIAIQVPTNLLSSSPYQRTWSYNHSIEQFLANQVGRWVIGNFQQAY